MQPRCRNLACALLVLTLWGSLAVSCGPTAAPAQTPSPAPLLSPAPELSPAPPVTPQPVPVATDRPAWLQGECPPDRHPAGDQAATDRPFYQSNFVILTGPLAGVNDLLADLEADLPVRLPLASVSLELDALLDDPLDKRCGALPGLWSPEEPYVMELRWICTDDADDVLEIQDYQDNETVTKHVFGNGASDLVPVEIAVLLYVNGWGRETQRGIFADLPYLTGFGGSPWTAMGSPWVGDMRPYQDVHANATLDDAKAAFRSQWALGPHPGIRLVDNAGRTTSEEGDRVRVGIFDTSPFTGPPNEPFVRDQLDWVSASLTLTVVLDTPYPPPQGASAAAPVDVSDHGLFVAGLIDAVAPGTQLYLYRVLDDHARGDLWTLNRSLYHFLVETLSAKHRLAGAVVNLSLGSQPPQDGWRREMELPLGADWTDYGLGEALLDQMWQAGGAMGLPQDVGVMSLKTLVAAAYCHGIPVIAAAGNESNLSSDWNTYLGAEIPAFLFPDALAVGGSTVTGERSCFANAGEILAPGGDGDAACVPLVSACSGSCQDGLLGPVTQHPGNTLGYAYWAGTSFSTPLVTGLAALVLGAQGAWRDPDFSAAFSGQLSDLVYGRIRTSAGLPAGRGIPPPEAGRPPIPADGPRPIPQAPGALDVATPVP